jgi:hypothetical protein
MGGKGRIWAFRGRPRGSRHSRFETRILEYLVTLSTKRGVDPTEFFEAIVRAWNSRKAVCRGLSIEFRIKKKDCAIFLVTEGNMVVAQFPVPEGILKETDPLKQFDYVRERIMHAWEVKKRMTLSSGNTKIRDLRAGMKRIKVKARIIEITEPKQVLTRLNDYAVFAKATLFDKTGTIKLTLWNGRIKMVSLNDIVQIENGSVIMFRGEKQLEIRRNATLEVVKPADLIQRNTA